MNKNSHNTQHTIQKSIRFSRNFSWIFPAIYIETHRVGDPGVRVLPAGEHGLLPRHLPAIPSPRPVLPGILETSFPANRIQERNRELFRITEVCLFPFQNSCKLPVQCLDKVWRRCYCRWLEGCLLLSRFLGRWCSRPGQLIIPFPTLRKHYTSHDLPQTQKKNPLPPLASKVGHSVKHASGKDPLSLHWSCTSCRSSGGSKSPSQISPKHHRTCSVPEDCYSNSVPGLWNFNRIYSVPYEGMYSRGCPCLFWKSLYSIVFFTGPGSGSGRDAAASGLEDCQRFLQDGRLSSLPSVPDCSRLPPHGVSHSW